MSNKKAKKQHPPKQESPEPDPEKTYTIGKVVIPKVVSQAIDGVMTASDLKYLWDLTPRFRLIQYREEEYVDDDDFED